MSTAIRVLILIAVGILVAVVMFAVFGTTDTWLVGVPSGIAAVLTWQLTGRKKAGLGAVMGATCPRCGGPLPAVRKPSTMQEMLWGGCTCPKCGCKVDRHGAERVAT
jgi:hypothetical protein